MHQKLFLDVNVFVAVVNKEYPAYESCSRVLSLASKSNYQLYCTTLTLGIVFYFAEKKFGREEAKKKLAVLSNHIQIAHCGELENRQTLANKKVFDYEDSLQYYSALNSNCSYLISLNTQDFPFAKIPVVSPIDFLIHHASR